MAMITNKTKILFLDIDGVLNNFKWSLIQPPGLMYRTVNDLDPENMKHLSKLLKAYPEVKVVVMSDWRKLMSLNELKSIFSNFEINPDQIIGYTPVVTRSQNREDEVLLYLQDNPCDDYALVDNDDFFNQLKPKLALTDPAIGLDEESINKIKSALNLF